MDIGDRSVNTINSTEDKTASSYLLDFAEKCQANWQKALIKGIVDSDDLLGREILDQILNLIFKEHNLDSKNKESGVVSGDLSTERKQPVVEKLELVSLKHIKGGNALKENTTIPFHPKLTLLYGANGSGKTGFVRILKRMAGSKTSEDILGDINSFNQYENLCEAEVELNVDGNHMTTKWSGKLGQSPLNRISIFDGRCVPIYLNDKLGFSFQPFGFEKFEHLSDAFSELQQRLDREIQDRRRRQPDLVNLFDLGTSAGLLMSELNSETNLKEFERITKWTKKKEKELVGRQKEINGLGNLDGNLEILRIHRRAVSFLIDLVESVGEQLSKENILLWKGLISKFNQLKKAKSKKDKNTLDDYKIAEVESKEWLNFIESADNYISLTEHEHYPTVEDRCVYCHQKLNAKAVKLINLYKSLSANDESVDLQEVEGEIDQIGYNFNKPTLKQDFEKIIESYPKLLRKSEKDKISALFRRAEDEMNNISEGLKNKSAKKFKSINTKSQKKILEEVDGSLSVTMGNIIEVQRDIEKKRSELESQVAGLKAAKKLASCLEKVKSFVETEKWIKQATSISPMFNTKPVTDLAKKAWSQLVSGKFQKEFELECRNMNTPVIELGFRGEYGSQLREKSLGGYRKIDKILSEGEQRAVALADFFSEQSMQNVITPVIFDDPANSFDHNRRRIIAERIVKESERRQVVVFTHDIVFASYVYENILKDNSIDKDKAIFHFINKDGGKPGNIDEDYYPGAITFDKQICLVKKNLDNAESVFGEERISHLHKAYSSLRAAVEKVVEERIFGGVVKRWKENIQFYSVEKASMSKERLIKASELFGKFSRYIDGHDHSNEMLQDSIPTIERLRQDIQEVEQLAIRG